MEEGTKREGPVSTRVPGCYTEGGCGTPPTKEGAKYSPSPVFTPGRLGLIAMMSCTRSSQAISGRRQIRSKGATAGQRREDFLLNSCCARFQGQTVEDCGHVPPCASGATRNPPCLSQCASALDGRPAPKGSGVGHRSMGRYLGGRWIPCPVWFMREQPIDVLLPHQYFLPPPPLSPL